MFIYSLCSYLTSVYLVIKEGKVTSQRSHSGSCAVCLLIASGTEGLTYLVSLDLSLHLT